MQQPNIWLKRCYWGIIILLILTGSIFYYWQNYAQGLGGKIALSKLLWLAYALWFWYFLPLLVIQDFRLNRQLKQGYLIFWLNMLLRAIVELWMMYVSGNWHPYLGINHNLFSLLLVFLLSRQIKAKTKLDKVIYFNFQVIGSLFAIESYFAWYMFHNVQIENSPVYFVPGTSEHSFILILTWILIAGLSLQQFILARQWLYFK